MDGCFGYHYQFHTLSQILKVIEGVGRRIMATASALSKPSKATGGILTPYIIDLLTQHSAEHR